MNISFINERKKALGLTNQMIAEQTGITLSTLDKITSGVNDNPKLNTLKAIASILNCNLDDLDSDEPTLLPSKQINRVSIGKRIKISRQARGYTQQELADMIGVAKNTITGYEKGNREPDATRIIALSKALVFPIDWIIGNNDDTYSDLSAEALVIALKYNTLNEYSKALVRLVIDHEANRPAMASGHQPPPTEQELDET